MKLTITLLLALGIIGCAKPKPYMRIGVQVNNDEPEIYWRERHPTTFHGICAHMYHSESMTIWVVEHPYGVNPKTHGSLGTEVQQFSDRKTAEEWAEALCPTK